MRNASLQLICGGVVYASPCRQRFGWSDSGAPLGSIPAGRTDGRTGRGTTSEVNHRSQMGPDTPRGFLDFSGTRMPNRMIAPLAAGAAVCLAGCDRPQPGVAASVQCVESASANREVVLSFYRTGLVERRPREAFEKYAAVDMLEHKPDVPAGTRQAVVEYLERLIAELPQSRWEILRAAAEGDLVFLHARFIPEPGAAPYAIADVFRLESCKIVEHWDVVGPPRDGQPNPNSRF